MSNLIVVVPELGCAYRWSEEYNQLEWNPMYANNTFDLDEWGCVEEDLVGGEPVIYNGQAVTLSQVYRDVENKLGAKQ